MTMPNHYYAFIIGTGHNGLTCACYLARADVYLRSSGNHRGPRMSMAAGRNAAQVTFGELGLDFRRAISGC
jgi:glycine/D-amino acid oxidase-like deaminating enzyme